MSAAGTSSLTEFLPARFDEDEASAREFQRLMHYPRPRLLDEVRGKRIILSHAMTLMVTSRSREQDDAADGILEALALPYSDHPDYQEKWKP